MSTLAIAAPFDGLLHPDAEWGGLSVRVARILRRSGYTPLTAAHAPDDELLALRGITPGVLAHIRRKLPAMRNWPVR